MSSTKKRFWKKWWFWVLVVLIIFVATSGGDNEETTVAPSNQENQQGDSKAEDNQDSKIEENQVFAVGDTINFDGLNITLNGVRTSKGDSFLTPENDKYLIVELTIENTESKPTNISTILQMNLLDAEAYKYSVALYTDTKGALDGELAAGRKVRGEVAFDVPDSEYYEFMFEDPFFSGQAIWKFSAE